MVNKSITLSDLTLDNPIIAASGTFGYGKEFAEFYDINILGSISIKGTTILPRHGNETPRIAECGNYGMLNSVGLQNPGVDEVIENILPQISEKTYTKPLIANIGGFSIDEYVTLAKKFSDSPHIGIIEVNISCPNVHASGKNFGSDAKSAYDVTRAVKQVSSKPIYMKLTPNVSDITEIAVACEEAGADGISMINTLLGMRIDLKTKKPVLANKMGGYSGPGIFPVALRMIYQVYEKVSIPIIGMGGISCAADVIEMMLAGATAVEIGAANLVNPCASKEIIETLDSEMLKYGIKDLKSIIGGAH